MKFVAVDFETANSQRGSACAVGFAFVENSKVVRSESYLIKPFNHYFDPMNISIHGITPKMVQDSPTWPEIWPDIADYFEGTNMMAHNAGFDFSVLRQLFAHYNIEHPTFDYCCTLQLSKQTFDDLPNYRLNTLCSFLDIDLNHHEAESDANASAELALRCFDLTGVKEFSDISNKYDVTLGKFFPGGYNGSLKTYQSGGQKLKDIKFDASNADPDGPIYGATFCFTGTLESYVRIEAQKMVLERGGNCKNGVTKGVNYLVLGEQDFSKYGAGFISSKTKKAEQYAEEGTGVKILSEWDFLDMI